MFSKIIPETLVNTVQRALSTLSRKKLQKSTTKIGAAHLKPLQTNPMSSFFKENTIAEGRIPNLVVDLQMVPSTENFTQGVELEKHYLMTDDVSFLKNFVSPWHDVRPHDVAYDDEFTIKGVIEMSRGSQKVTRCAKSIEHNPITQ